MKNSLMSKKKAITSNKSSVNQISSGETKVLIGMQEQFLKCYEDDEDGIYSWTAESFIGGEEVVFDEFKKRRAVPKSEYVLNYIFLKFSWAVARENQRIFLNWIKSKRKNELDKISKNGNKNREENLLMNFLAHDEKDVQKEFGEYECVQLWYAFTTQLSNEYMTSGYEHVEEIDWRELLFGEYNSGKRGYCDGFNHDKLKSLALGIRMTEAEYEIFLKKVLRRSSINFYDRDEVFVYIVLMHGEGFENKAYYKAYGKLKELYPESISELYYKTNQKEKSSDDGDTYFFHKKLDDILNTLEEDLLFEKVDVTLQDYLNEIYVRAQKIKNGEFSRTRKKIMEDLWEKLKLLIKERVDDDEEENRALHTLTVKYNVKEGVKIPKGTKFTAKSRMNKVDVVCKTVEEVYLPPKDAEEVIIKIKALTKKEDYKDHSGLKEIKKKKIEEDQKLEVKSGECQAFILETRPSKAVNYFTDVNENGELLVKCKLGKVIPKGTQFYFEKYGMKFEYESIEDANIDYISLDVRPLQKWSKEEYEDFNKKENVVQGAKLSVESGETTNGILEVYTDRKTELSLFGQAKGDRIKIKALKEHTIPEGTVFVYCHEGKEFRFESLSSETVQMSSEKEILCDWYDSYKQIKGIKNNKGSDNKNDVEILPTKKRFDFQEHKFPNIYSVYTKGRFVLKDEEEIKDSNMTVIKVIYGMKDHPELLKEEDYKGYKEYGEDFFFNSEEFRSTLITNGKYQKFEYEDENMMRNRLITLKFMDFVLEADDMFTESSKSRRSFEKLVDDASWNLSGDEKESEKRKKIQKKVIRGFTQEMDKLLDRCGFQLFFSANFPYDLFIVMLLSSDDPLLVFQEIWSLNWENREKFERNQ